MNMIAQRSRKWLINVYRFFLLNLQPHYRINLTQISFRISPLIASSAVAPDNSLSSEPFSQHQGVLKSHAMTHNASRWRNTVTVEASEVSSQISPQNFHLNQFAWEMTLHVCFSSSIMKTTPPPKKCKIQIFNNMEVMCYLFNMM